MWKYLKGLFDRLIHLQPAKNNNSANEEMPRPQLLAPETIEATPNHKSIDNYLENWELGNWTALLQITLGELANHPDRARIAILVAIAHEQHNDFFKARHFLQSAHTWGASKRQIAQLLISGVHNSLGRARLACGIDDKALTHFELSLPEKGTTGANQAPGNVRMAHQAELLNFPKTPSIPSTGNFNLEKTVDFDSGSIPEKKYANFRVDVYWDERYRNGGNSGFGSYGRLAEFKAQTINTFIVKNEIEDVIEFGCGDGNQLSMLCANKYIGVDISPTVVSMCQNKFKDDLRKTFLTMDEFMTSSCRAQLTLSLDVIFHLVEDRVFNAYMIMLLDASDRFCIIYASDTEDRVDPAIHVRHRKFSNWIAENRPNWRLIDTIYNKFPHDGSINPKDLSFSNFYFYERSTPATLS